MENLETALANAISERYGYTSDELKVFLNEVKQMPHSDWAVMRQIFQCFIDQINWEQIDGERGAQNLDEQRDEISSKEL